MKVLLHYEDNKDTELWKSLKITLPKSWKIGPTSKLLGQFVESYNSNDALGGVNPLQQDALHLAVRQPQSDGEPKSILHSLASDAIILDCISDRADIYVLHGPSQTLQDIEVLKREELAKDKEQFKNTYQCTRFGCKNRFPKGGPYPSCRYHKSPPVFHETAKFWSCCPNTKAYDWEDFQNIPGCCEDAACTDVKDNEGQKLFLGGSDLREKAGEAVKLKSIDDFNKAQAAGGSDAAPTLERLQLVLEELGIEKELFQQVVEGLRNEFAPQVASEVELLECVKKALGGKLKANLKTIAVEQLRIT